MAPVSQKRAIRLDELWKRRPCGFVWDPGEATVQDVVRALEASRSTAYTTVLTVMSRLTDKGLLSRRKNGRAFVFRPVTPHRTVAGSLLSTLVERLYAGSTARGVEHLTETEADVDERELARLESLIRAKRRSRRTRPR